MRFLIRKVLLLLSLIVFGPNSYAEDCDNTQRGKNYNDLKAQLTMMHDLLPAIKPEDKRFYKEVQKNLYTQPKKYERYLSDNDFVIFSNTEIIEHLLYWSDSALKGLRENDFSAEIHAFSRIMISGVKDVKWLESFSDSQYMANKGIVSRDYEQLGKQISIMFGGIALCMANHAEMK